jgi:hypothetical protein
MLDEQRETLLLHEMGEHAAGLALGDDWERFMGRLQDRRVEILARAVRDLLADCLVTLPAIAASLRPSSSGAGLGNSAASCGTAPTRIHCALVSRRMRSSGPSSPDLTMRRMSSPDIGPASGPFFTRTMYWFAMMKVLQSESLRTTPAIQR